MLRTPCFFVIYDISVCWCLNTKQGFVSPSIVTNLLEVMRPISDCCWEYIDIKVPVYCLYFRRSNTSDMHFHFKFCYSEMVVARWEG